MKTTHKLSAKVVALIVVLTFAFCGAIGGTVAWIIDKTETVTNTFTYGDINITLTETDADGDQNLLENTYKMVPGGTIAKDPKVTVKAGSEKCYLFVKLEEVCNADGYAFKDFLSYTVVNGWTQLQGETGVYYRVVESGAPDREFWVLVDNQVTVKDDVTKEMFNALGENYPQLLVTAYAVQFDNVTNAAEAWGLIE